MDVTGDRSKVPCCKEQYCIRTWNQGKLEVVKQDGKSEHRHSRFLCNIALYSIRPCFYQQSHQQLGISFALAPSLHSSLISSSILGTYQPGEFIFQCAVFLPFHTVHRFLKARILKWFAIPFSSGPQFVRTLYHDPFILGDPTRHGSYFH